MRNLFLGGGRPQLFREKCLNFVCRCLQKGRAQLPKWTKIERSVGILSAAAPKMVRATIEVDKNEAKSPNFVYRGLVSCHIGKCCQNQPARGPSSQRLIQMQHRITAASKSTGFYKKRTAENRTVLEMCRVYLFLSY